jgi:hypothetical protein
MIHCDFQIMKKVHQYVFLILFLTVAVNIIGQKTNVYGVFPTYNQWGKLNEKTNYELYYFTAAPIFGDVKYSGVSPRNWLLMYAEQSITYSPVKSWGLTGSYVYQVENGYDKANVDEHRLFLQTYYALHWNKVTMKHRLRHDSRFFSDVFKHRLRYQIALRGDWESGNYWTIGQEFFFELTNGSEKLYNENWFNTGIGIKLNDQNYLELGALNVTWATAKGRWFNQWYFQPTWVYRLDFSRKENG